jgi:hypothetical protein
MDDESRALRARIEALQVTGRGRRYPEELKRDLLGYVARVRLRGVTVHQLEGALGVSWHTLARWRRRTPHAPKLLPVRVHEASAAATGQPVLVSPSGWRVEGLSLEQLGIVLARL